MLARAVLARGVRCYALQRVSVRVGARALTTQHITQELKGDWEKVIFPLQGRGCDPELNWSLNMHQVAPAHNAHRNLPAKALVSHATGRLDESRALHVQGDDGNVPVFVHRDLTFPHLDKVVFPTTPCDAVQTPRHRKLVSMLTAELRHSPDIFVHDFTVHGVRMRLITHDPAAALFVHNLTGVSAAPAEDIFEFAASASVIIHAPNADVTKTGIKLGTKPFAVFDPCRNVTLLGGSPNTQAIADAIHFTLANNLALDKAYGLGDGALFACSSLVAANATTAVFGADHVVTAMAELHGAHAHVVGPSSVHAVYGGVVHDSAVGVRHEFDLVEDLPSNRVRVTQRLAPAPSAPALKRFVLVANDASRTLPALAELTPSQAQHHFFFGSRGAGSRDAPCFTTAPAHYSNLAADFRRVVEQSKATVYLVNSAVAGAATASILRSLAAGNAGQFAKSAALGMSVCSQLPSVEPSVLKSNATAAKVKTLAQQRAEQLVNFHGAVEEAVMEGALPQ